MFGTKVEITLPKAEPGTWANLNFPPKTVPNKAKEQEKEAEPVKPVTPANEDDDSDLDLDDIQQVRGVRISEA